ncbi:MAG: type VI secretion system Vgr family protein [Polyangiales bacterium]
MPSIETFHVRIASEAIDPETVQVARLEGVEAISQPYAFDVLVYCSDINGLDEAALLDKGIAIVFERGGEAVRTIHGMVAEIRDLGLTQSELIAYQVKIVPRAWALSLGATLDIYMDATIPEIVAQRLSKVELFTSDEGSAAKKAPADVDMRLSENYASAEFVVQYKETDLAFVSRLTENLGISFYFTEQNDRDVIVFTDNNAGFESLDPEDHPISWRGDGEKSGVFELRSVTRPIPHRYVAHDYNYRMPQVEVYGETAITVPGPGRDLIEYGTHCKTPLEAAWFSRIRAEESRASRKVYSGKSTDARMRAGTRFKLSDHPRGDIELLITEVRHKLEQSTSEGSHDEEYECEFKAIESSITYRPPRVTPKPRIAGVLTGRIEADGDYADIDDQGRYRVQFLFDTADRGEQAASRPIRMMQPHSGPGYGMHFPLRGGIEVALTFVDGDPDRPIIAGTVPNPTTSSPVSDGNSRRNVIRTGGGNEINIDDDKASPRIKLTTPRNNTMLQLGAPNGNEDGILMATAGASTQTATLGIGAIGSLKTGISLLQDWRSAGDIISLAQPPGKMEKMLAMGELIDCAAELTGAGVEFAKSIKEGGAAKDQSVADTSQESADKKQSTMIGKQRDLKTKKDALDLDTAPPDSDTSDAANAKRDLKAKYDAYQAVRTRLDTDSTGELASLKSARDAYYLTHRKIADGGKTGLEDQQKQDADNYISAAQTVLASREEIDGDESPQAGNEALDLYNAAHPTATKQTLWETIPAATQASALTPDKLTQLNAACDAYKNTLPKDKQQSVDDFKTAVGTEKTAYDDLQTQNADVAMKQREADDSNYIATSGTDAKNMAKASLAANAIRTGMALYSTVLGVYNMFKNSAEGATNEIAWTRLVTDMKLLSMRGFQGAQDPLRGELKFQDENYAMHLIGATDATGVYALDRLFMWSPSVNIHGSDQVIIMAGKENTAVTADRIKSAMTPNPQSYPSGALVMAKERGEFKAKTLFLSGQKIDLKTCKWPFPVPDTQQTLVFDAEKDLVEIGGKKVAAEAKISIDTSSNAKIELASEKAAQKAKLTLDQGKAETEVSQSLALKIGDDCKIEADKKSITIDAGDSGRIVIKAGGFQVSIGKSGVTIEKPGGNKVVISSSSVLIKGGASASITISSSGTTVAGKFATPSVSAQ